MRKKKITFVLDATALLLLFLVGSTGFLLRRSIPPAVGTMPALDAMGAAFGRVTLFMGLNRVQWGEIHFGASVILMVVLCAYVGTEWTAIQDLIHGRSTDGSVLRALVGFVSLGCLLVAVVSQIAINPYDAPRPAMTQPLGPTPQEAAAPTRDELYAIISSSATLNSIFKQAGIPPEFFIFNLHLATDVGRDVPISQIASKYRITVEDVRRTAQEFLDTKNGAPQQ